MKQTIAAVCLVGSLFPFTARACDLALSLALDISSSLNPEQRQQIRVGTAAALMDPEVVQAFTHASVWLQIFEWADDQRILVDWRQIANSDDMADLATALTNAPNDGKAGAMTGMGPAMLFARAQFDKLDCDRNVLDIMTDGQPNDGVPVAVAREQFDEGAHEINVLFLGDNPKALAQMNAQVKFGYGAFVQPVADLQSYQHGMLRKLLREISMNVPNRSEG